MSGRQVVLDTETTGMEPAQGHRIIEIGCVEVVARRVTEDTFHRYLNPERPVDEGAQSVHGLSDAFLADKPRFEEVAKIFVDYIRGAELIIHNAPFDVGFIDHELRQLGPAWGRLEDYCTVTDTLVLARRLHPGQRCSLDALCKRYGVDGSRRELHGALLDAELLADVYLAMTGGQAALSLGGDAGDGTAGDPKRIRRLPADRPRLRVPEPDEEERAAHQRFMAKLSRA